MEKENTNEVSLVDSPIIAFKSFPDWSALQEIDYAGSFWDDQELQNLNGTMIRTALNLKEINKKLDEAQRRKITAENTYKQKMRRYTLSVNGKTETEKKRLAEIMCEKDEMKVLYYEQIIRELERLANACRYDLEVFKTIGNNLRQEMRI